MLVDVPGEGELDQDAVHRGVGVELGDLVQQGLLGGLGGETGLEALEPAQSAVLFLVADIDLGGGIIAHQNDRQPRLAGEEGGLLRHLLPQLFGRGLAVYDDCHDACSFPGR